jgi:hypothetical protein
MGKGSEIKEYLTTRLNSILYESDKEKAPQ